MLSDDQSQLLASKAKAKYHVVVLNEAAFIRHVFVVWTADNNRVGYNPGWHGNYRGHTRIRLRCVSVALIGGLSLAQELTYAILDLETKLLR